MPPKKAQNASPYFISTPTRSSTRVSNASSTKKRQPTPSSESEFDDSDSSESDYHDVGKSANKNRRVKLGQSSEAEQDNSDEDEDENEDEESSDDDSKPPRTIIIPIIRARKEGDTPYEDGRIHENTLLFLKDLKAHNSREWMRLNDEDFRASQKDFASFVNELSPLVAEKDFTIPELPSKDIVFRIYRDVRFSNDKTPYKPYFSAAWSRTGRKGPYAAYYLHLEPNGHAFIGGGLWNPEAASLEKIREDIDQNPRLLKQALMTPDLKRDFWKGAKDEKAIVEAFTRINAANALKTKPRGYEIDHKDIKLLRLRNFAIRKKLEDSDLTKEDSLERIADLFGAMVPFITYLNSIVRPDRNAAAADSSDSDDSDD